jgi:hypothetical protein
MSEFELTDNLTPMPGLLIGEMRVRVSRNCVRLEVFAPSQEQLLDRDDATRLRDWLTAALDR